MSDLKQSIQQSKAERTKKLEALRKQKMEREAAKQRTSNFLDPSQREDMNRSYNSDLSLNASIDQSSILPPVPLKADIGIKNTGRMYLMPKSKAIVYERGIQVEIETDSEDEERLESMKGVRTAANERAAKVEVKDEEAVEVAKAKELEPEEAEAIMAAPEFKEFFDRCAFTLEKALVERFDVIEDFILQQKIEDPFDQKGKMKLIQLLHYAQEDRCVSSLEWSPHFDDTLIATYVKSGATDLKTSQGLINIWHLEDPSKPKHTLHSQGSITQAQIYPNDPNILISGSYSGQLLIWDLRAKALPIQRSPALSGGHSYPIVSVSFAESRHSSNAVSLSSDGKFCVWMMSILQSPVETYEIKHRNELCVNCIHFNPIEPWSYTVGTEEGTVLSGVLQGTLNIEKDEISGTSMAPITSVHNHPNEETDLLLVSSVDWTVKVYSNETQKCLMNIDAYDEYVYDAKWNPNNPCLFACCDGDGFIDVWDLGKSLEMPFTRQNTSAKALNKLAWDNSGYRIAAGNSASAIYVYQLEKDYSHNKNEDWLKALMHLTN